MDFRKCRMFALLILLCGAVMWLLGCAATGESIQGEQSSSDVMDIDELLGLKEETSPAEETTGDTIAEDDVLRLLGVVDEEETPPSVSEETQDRTALTEEVKKLEAQNEAQMTQQGALQQEADAQKDRVTAVENVRESGAATAGPSWSTTSFQDRYQEARQDYNARRYRQAIQKYEALLGMDSRHSLSDNCQYWIGESYYGLGNYQQAIVAFEKVFAFPNSNKDADSQLKLGICYMRLSDNEKAKREFQKLIDNYPTSEYVSVAKRYLDRME